MIWTYGLDDFSGQVCGQGKYPLINAVKEVLSRGPTPTPPPMTSTLTPTTTTPRMTTMTLDGESPPEKILVCYYTNWAQYRPGVGRFVPESIDPFLCTHIHYAFAVIKDGELKPFEWNDDDSEWGQRGNYAKVSYRWEKR